MEMEKPYASIVIDCNDESYRNGEMIANIVISGNSDDAQEKLDDELEKICACTQMVFDTKTLDQIDAIITFLCRVRGRLYDKMEGIFNQ